MKIFSYFYDKMMNWARHEKAPWFLAGLSFAESSFFPIPPDVMLAPMCLGQPERAFSFASITTLASVIGGMLGYLIGASFFSFLQPYLEVSSYWDSYQLAVEWFGRWGFAAIFLAGFSPIPYKIFTIAAGAMAMSFFPFVVASAIGRGMRFYLVAGLMRFGGAKMEERLRDYVDYIGWGIVVIALLFIFLS